MIGLHAESSVVVSRPLQDVREFLRSDENISRWDGEVLRSRLIDGSPGQVGARYERVRQDTSFGPTDDSVASVWELSELTDRRVAFSRVARETLGGVRRTVADLEPVGEERTHVTLGQDWRMPRWMAWTRRSRTLDAIVHKELRKLAEVLSHELVGVQRPAREGAKPATPSP